MKKQKSLRQLARELGVSHSYLSQVRHGKCPASQKVVSKMVSSGLLKVDDLGYNRICAEVAQSVEQRTENPKLGIPSCTVRYKLELLCQLPNPHSEAKVPFGDILSFLVCRQNVANFWCPFTRRLPCGSLRGVAWPWPR